MTRTIIFTIINVMALGIAMVSLCFAEDKRPGRFHLAVSFLTVLLYVLVTIAGMADAVITRLSLWECFWRFMMMSGALIVFDIIGADRCHLPEKAYGLLTGKRLVLPSRKTGLSVKLVFLPLSSLFLAFVCHILQG